MRFYHYLPDANRFAGVGFSMADNEQVVQIHFTDRALADEWTVPVAHGFVDNPNSEGDFPSLSNFNEIPIMSHAAWQVLRPLIDYCCEDLPIIHPTGRPYMIIHVMDTIDCLDFATSELTRNATTGRVDRIRRYGFKHFMLLGKHIFKLPLESGGELIVDDEFRRLVEANDLKGLLFKELALVT